MKLLSDGKNSTALIAPQTFPSEGSRCVTVELTALVVSSDPEHGQILAAILGHCGLGSVLCSSLDEARRLLESRPIQLVFCEDTLLDGSFQDLLRIKVDSGTGVPLVIFSRAYGWNQHLETVRSGAFAYVASPFRSREIERIVQDALIGHGPRRQRAKPQKGSSRQKQD